MIQFMACLLNTILYDTLDFTSVVNQYLTKFGSVLSHCLIFYVRSEFFSHSSLRQSPFAESNFSCFTMHIDRYHIYIYGWHFYYDYYSMKISLLYCKVHHLFLYTQAVIFLFTFCLALYQKVTHIKPLFLYS